MLRMCVPHGRRRGAWKEGKFGFKLKDSLWNLVTCQRGHWQKMSGNHCYTRAEPCSTTPTNTASRVTVTRATSSARIPPFPPKLPASTQNEGGILQQLRVGARLLESEDRALGGNLLI